jgi:hypothetical protein
VVTGSTGVGRHRTTISAAAVEHWDGTSWSIVASPNPNPGGDSSLVGIAAISANDIWAVGGIGTAKTLTEHWDGTSWSIIPSPSPAANQNQLFAVTALSDGTVAAVGHQEGVSTDQPLILQNAASAPQTPTGMAPLVTSSSTTFGTQIDDHTRTLLAHRDTALVDQVFTAAGKSDQRLWLADHSARTRPSVTDSDRNDFPGGL